MNTILALESVLFVASEPLTIQKLAKSLDVNIEEIDQALAPLILKYSPAESGIVILRSGDEIQMTTNPELATTVEQFTKSEVFGELTKAQLETLTVIGYRGPITRPELEQIRGVNCAVIIRNLLLRGLVEEKDKSDSLMPVYEISIDAMRQLGISSTAELPDYDALHNHEYIQQVVGDQLISEQE
jgi:segregation and condensation protein B